MFPKKNTFICLKCPKPEQNKEENEERFPHKDF